MLLIHEQHHVQRHVLNLAPICHVFYYLASRVLSDVQLKNTAILSLQSEAYQRVGNIFLVRPNVLYVRGCSDSKLLRLCVF